MLRQLPLEDLPADLGVDEVEHDDVVAEPVEQLRRPIGGREVVLDRAFAPASRAGRTCDRRVRRSASAPAVLVLDVMPRLEVKIRTHSEKYAVSPRPSVSRPSSRICRNLSRIRGCAFSISSNSTTRNGLLPHRVGQLAAGLVARRSRAARRCSRSPECSAENSLMSKRRYGVLVAEDELRRPPWPARSCRRRSGPAKNSTPRGRDAVRSPARRTGRAPARLRMSRVLPTACGLADDPVRHDVLLARDDPLPDAPRRHGLSSTPSL